MTECLDTNVLEELIALLALEKIEENLFRGQSQDLGFGSVFGGQVLGQALSAASQTVPEDQTAHSLHGYFMRPGIATQPIVYMVDCIRDGKSFTTRRVVAIQKGRPIFSMSVSFQIAEIGFEHQDEPPAVQGPDGVDSDLVFAARFKDRIPPGLRSKILCRKPIEMRPLNPVDPFSPEKMEPVRTVWVKAIDALPDVPSVHQYMLAYASDFGLVATTLYPHGHSLWEQDIQAASLDHAMWFHRPFRMDEWLLYVMESPSASNARGLSIGKVFTRDGRLAATVAQEGLIRYRKPGR
jgi:acyl-CoA thioesterase-2